jgi:glycine/D-amino acid oxidase-like deaminating enzyme
MTHDVIVIGLGHLGGAAAHRLASRGLRVLGLDSRPRAELPGTDAALLAGADLRFEEMVIDWYAERSGTGARVLTWSSTHAAPLLVICPGSAARTLLANLGEHAEQVLLGPHPWFPQVLIGCGSTDAAQAGDALADMATGALL